MRLPGELSNGTDGLVAMASTTGANKDVCVIGTGVLGLLAIKNLKEQGLQPTAFEQNEFVGGNWHVSERDQTTATEGTTLNTSTQVVSISSVFGGLLIGHY